MSTRHAASVQSETRPIGVWHAIGRGGKLFVPIVIVHALAQAGLVAIGAAPRFEVVFTVLAVVSLLLVGLAIAATSAAAVAAVTGARFRMPVRVPVAAVLGVALTVAAGLLHPLLALAVAIIGAYLVVQLASGHVPGRWLMPVRRAPLRTVGWALLSIAAILAVVLVQFEAGFLVAGPLAAAGSWAFAGVAGVLVLTGAAHLDARAELRPERARRHPHRG